ncbi:MAG: VWA domain-containing protein [Xenococcaceae cyanobacterium]
MMRQLFSNWQQLRQKLRKPILFGVCGATGCLAAAAALGELFLQVTQPPPIIERDPQMILLLIDTSGSMEGEKLQEVKAAAKSFVARQNLSQDSFAVVGFGSEIQVGTGLTSDLTTLNQAIDALADGGGTRMDLGIEQAIQELQTMAKTPHILLFTDGQPGGQILPQAITLLIDTSGSMDGEKLAEVKAAAKGFVARQDLSQNRLAVIGFGTYVQKETGLTSEQTTLNQAIDALADGGGTRMDLAIEAGITELSKTPLETTERYILLFTDGQPSPQPPSEQIDVMFVLDVTSSMNEEIRGVQQGIQNFARELEARKLNARVGLIAFGDRLLGEEPQILSFDGSAFTANPTEFSRQVGAVAQVGGGDAPESSFDAIAQAASQSFRAPATKVMILITDAPPKIPDRDISSLPEVAKILQDQDIDQLHLVVQQRDRPLFERLQETVPGEVFLLGETAAGRQGFERILPLVGKQIAETALKLTEREPIITATQEAGKMAEAEKINIIAVGTGDADTDFLSQLTGNPDQVFYAKAGNIDQAFQQAEKRIAGDDLEQALADTLKVREKAKNQGINIVAVGTGDADTGFLSQLTGDSKLVFYANSGNFEEAFRGAEKSIYQPLIIEKASSLAEEGVVYTFLRQSIGSELLEDYRLAYGVLRNGGWTAILAIGTSLALIVGQNLYQRRRVLSIGETTVGTVGSLGAGITAGALGQLVYIPFAGSMSMVATGGQLIGWILLGTLLGGGMSFFVPNLKKHRGLLGGCFGGALGGISFILIPNWSGAIAARLVGSAMIGFWIGIMIALLELLSTEARLIVHWTPTEQREILLGTRPVVLGSSQEVDIYLPKNQGYPPIAAKIFQEEEKIIIQFDEAMKTAKKMQILRQELKDGSRRKLGDVLLEVRNSQP